MAISVNAGDNGNALLERLEQSFNDDLEGIQNRGYLRVLVSYSQTNFFITLGQKRGYEYELFQQYGKFLNRNRSIGKEITIVYVPVVFDRLIPSLIEGKGDIVAAGLTITGERSREVAFTQPYLPNIDEIIITCKKTKTINSLHELSGRDVYVLKGSSYVQHLKKLNNTLRTKGMSEVRIIEADEYLRTEDILEMVNAGIVEVTVSDRHIAELWSSVFTDIIIHNDLKVNTEGQIGWAVRKNNPKLLVNLNEFIKDNKKGTLIGNILFKRYYENTKWIKNPITEDEQKKLRELRPVFKKYAGQYGFDWLLIAAMGYQESGLNINAKSNAGAVGIMQLLPSTAADSAVNIPDIYKTENNIHAGVKYLAYLRDTFFADEQISPEARIHFSLAAYNAGPGRVRQLRKRAKGMGLDPNKWFYNVSHAALEIVGQETVNYVRNIHKYYVAYKLSSMLHEQKTTSVD